MYDLPRRPVITPTSRSHMRRCSFGLIRPTQGAEHLPIDASRQGRFVSCALWNTFGEQVRTGNALSSRSKLLRISHTLA